MEKEEQGEFRDFTTPGNVKEYKNKVIFLRKSKKGDHLYAFDNEEAFAAAVGGSIIMNVSDVIALVQGKFESIKVSIMEKKED